MANNDFFSWDSEISVDSEGFIILPEGDYTFEVQKLDKEFYQGSSEKIGNGCPTAVLGLVIRTPQGAASIQDKLYLCKNMEWKLSAFFRCIGQKQHGKSFKMDWNKVIGSNGKCHVKVEKWIGNDGKERESNRIDRYYDSIASTASTAPSANADGSMPFEI